MKKITAWIMTACLMLALAGCSGGNAEAGQTDEPDTGSEASSNADTSTSAGESEDEENGAVLVVYFSATGTTKGVAEKIASVTNADICEIVPAEPYTTEDLNYNDRSTRATVEQNTPDARPEIAWDASGGKIQPAQYETVYVGYPIWWGEEPRIMDTFAEAVDFGNATVIPFCTSGGSGIGRSGTNLAEHAGSGNWLSGGRLNGSVSEDELAAWISDMR